VQHCQAMSRPVTAVIAIIGMALVLAAFWSVARPPPDLPSRPAPGIAECDPLATASTDPACMTDEQYRTYLGPAYERGTSPWTPIGFGLGAALLVLAGVLLLRLPPTGGDTMLSSLLRVTPRR
jgi:hypothetical protein